MTSAILALIALLACTGDTPTDSGTTADSGTTDTGTTDTGTDSGTTDTDTDTTALPDPSGVLDDTDADGCNRFRYTPPDVMVLEDHDTRVRLALRGDFGGIGKTTYDPVTLTFDAADGTSVLLEFLDKQDWEVGCGSIEEAADLPHADSQVFWPTSGTATLSLSPRGEDTDWMWEGTLTLDDLVFTDADGGELLEVEHHEVAARYNADPPA